MSKIAWRAGTLLAPLPAVLVSCGSVEKPNAATVAWTGILCSNPPVTYVSLRPERYSHELISKSGVFVINLVTSAMARAVDYCGVRSGRNEDKLKKVGLTCECAQNIDCASIVESPVSLECRVRQVVPLGSHDMFMADILCVTVDEGYIDNKGRLNLAAAGLLHYSHGEYFAQGKRLGSFGYTVKKKGNKK